MLMPKNRKTSLDIFQIIQKAYLFWEMRRKMSTMFKANKLFSVQLVQIWPYFTRQSIFNERKESFRFLNIIISIWTYKTTSEIIFHTINQFIQLRWRQLFWCSWEKFTFCIKAYKVHFLLFPSSMKRNKKTRFENTKVHACENKTFKIASAMKEKYAMMKKRSSAIPQMANKFVVYILSTKTFHSF